MPFALADRPDSKAGLPQSWVVGLSLLLALAVAVTGWLVLRDDARQADLPQQQNSRVNPASAATTLGDLRDAWAAGDEASARALAADSGTGDLLAAVARTVHDADITSLDLRYVDELGAADPGGVWPAAVDLTWQVRGIDRVPARTEVRATFVARDGEARIAGLGGGEERSPTWLVSPMTVTRHDGLLVLAASSLGERATRWSTVVRRALPHVRRAVPGWDGGVVVEIPPDAEGVDRALDVESGTYAQVAAVTATADGTTAPTSPVRVLLNPGQMASQGPLGAMVVVRHELAHVALGAATGAGTLPVWLAEGTADVVALDGVRVPFERATRQVRAQVRREGVPDHLPGPAEFDTVRGTHLGAAYEAAWLACALVADRAGRDALLAVYRAAEGGTPVDRALRAHAGLGERELLLAWQARLRTLSP